MNRRFGGRSGKLMAGVAVTGAAAEVLKALADTRRGEKGVTDITQAGLSLLQSVTSHLQARHQAAAEEEPQAAPPPPRPSPDGLSRAGALARLGLPQDATDEQIRSEHRRLMQQVHPDIGGNVWLAQQLNEARDFLLASRNA